MNKILFGIALIMFWGGYSFGQLYSDAPFSDTTLYKTTTPNDKVFVFPVEQKATLGAKKLLSPDTLKYVWAIYDSSLKSFTFLQSEVADSATFETSTQGLYQVSIIDTIKLDTLKYRAWVFFDSISFDYKTESLCTALKFRLENVKLDTVAYYDPLSKVITKIFNRASIEWSYGGVKTTTKSYFHSAPAPTDTTEYTITLTNVYKNSLVKKYEMTEPIATKALYKFEEDGEPVYKLDTSDPTGGAPLTVKFSNKSENGDVFEWYFLAEYRNSDNVETTCTYKPTVIYQQTESLSDTVYSTFYSPGKYVIKLVSKNNTCDPDTFAFIGRTAETADFKYSLNISASKYLQPGDLPEAFNPSVSNFKLNVAKSERTLGSAEGMTTLQNSQWNITEMSIRDFKINIFDRWGREVYSFDGALESIDNEYWEGWNGKKDNKGADCPAGIYYYVVEMSSWEDSLYVDRLIKNPAKSKGSKQGGASTTETGAAGNAAGSSSDASGSKARYFPRYYTKDEETGEKTILGQHTGYVYLFR